MAPPLPIKRPVVMLLSYEGDRWDILGMFENLEKVQEYIEGLYEVDKELTILGAGVQLERALVVVDLGEAIIFGL